MKTKKEIRNEYKQIKFRKGVFQIRNKSNGKVFIGSSVNLDKVWNSQKFKLETGIHSCRELQEDYGKSGADNFVFEIIEVLNENGEQADPEKEVKELEEICLMEIRPYGEKGYNKET